LANSSYSYDAVGTREDLLDIITNITPDETPLFSRFSKTKSDGMTHSWLTDSLSAPAVNKHKEDEVFSTTSTVARVKLTNYVQIFMKGLIEVVL
jgi:hypothetical protein